MSEYPLQLRSGLMFLSHDGLWLLDTGSPVSFSAREEIELAGRRFSLARDLMGHSAENISQLVSFEVAGLLGNDVIGELDWRFDLPSEQVTVSTEPLPIEGPSIELSEILGVPVLPAEVGGQARRVLLDTGAELSYFPPQFFDGLSANGRFRDYNPVLGWFEVDLYSLDARIGDIPFTLRCAPVPEGFGLLQMTFQMAGAEGLVGIQILSSHQVLYSPRRSLLQLGAPGQH